MNLLMPGLFVPAETVVHRVDPRVKMVAALVLTVLPFAAPGSISSALVVGFVATIAVLARVPPVPLLRTLRNVLWIGLFMFFFYVFSTPGREVWRLAGLSVTDQGLIAGLRQIYRLSALVVVASLLTYTTSPTQLAHSTEVLLRPLARIGFPVRELAMVLTIALRFVPAVADQVDKVRKSQRARGIDPGLNPVRRVRSWVPLFVPVFVLAYRRAEHLATALEARGFRGAEARTRLYQLKIGRRDLWAALCVALLALFAVVASHL